MQFVQYWYGKSVSGLTDTKDVAEASSSLAACSVTVAVMSATALLASVSVASDGDWLTYATFLGNKEMISRLAAT